MCTVAFIISILGYMPPPGTVITVPYSEVLKLRPRQVSAAKACARKLKIEYRIDEDR